MSSRQATPEAAREQAVLLARRRGEISCDASFSVLYDCYSALVTAWLAVRVDIATAQDLSQDVWATFYRRWRSWQHRPEMETPDARPILSFLFRTAHFVLTAHRRQQHTGAPLEESAPCATPPAAEDMLSRIEAARALRLARELCSQEELEALLARLSGVSLREVAVLQSTTTATVDHRVRRALRRLRAALAHTPFNPRSRRS